jgi:hypothetical protein
VLKLSEALSAWEPAHNAAPAEPLALLEAGWEQIVGAKVAQNSRPAKIADGTLTITTRSSAWSHQLSFLSDHVLHAVGARLPDSERFGFASAASWIRRTQRCVHATLRAGGRNGPAAIRPTLPKRSRAFVATSRLGVASRRPPVAQNARAAAPSFRPAATGSAPPVPAPACSGLPRQPGG